MKLAALTLALFAGLACANPPAPTLTLTTANKVQSAAAVSAYSLGAGSSLSTASGFQTATSFAAGAGTLSSSPASQRLSLGDCAPSTSVYGTLTTGSLAVTGFTYAAGTSDARNVSYGAGTGNAEAMGLATATAAGTGSLVTSNIDMKVDGTAYSGSLTHAIAEFNQVGTSAGRTSASFNSTTSGSLFTFTTPTGAGDVKIVNTNVAARAGDQGCSSGCGRTLDAVSVNATIEAGATGTANTTIVKP
jgi:hypothetical protein